MSTHPAEEWEVFSDESGLDERHIAIGAIFLPAAGVPTASNTLETFCNTRGFPDAGNELEEMQQGRG